MYVRQISEHNVIKSLNKGMEELQCDHEARSSPFYPSGRVRDGMN